MRAAVVRSPGAGPEIAEHPDPVSVSGRSIVEVSAAPVVPLDLLCASGTSYFGQPVTPYVPGVQGVGTVVESARHAAGTRVWFATSAGMAPGDGALAELCSVADDDLVALDVEVDETVLAALGLSAVAAWMCLTWRAGFQPGETVLVLGGGGVVGQSAIGAARVLGADRVVAMCRAGDSASRALAAGADEVVEYVADVTELTDRLRAVCPSVDVVIDPVFGPAASAAAQVLAPGGRLVNLGGSAADSSTFSSAVLRSRSASVLGYTNNALSVGQRASAIGAIAEHAVAGRLQVSHRAMPLTDVATAWQECGRTGVRAVLRP